MLASPIRGNSMIKRFIKFLHHPYPYEKFWRWPYLYLEECQGSSIEGIRRGEGMTKIANEYIKPKLLREES